MAAPVSAASMTDATIAARAILQLRLSHFPANPFYHQVAAQLALIDKRLSAGPPPDRAFYDALTHGLGLMCARELEQTDPIFCDAIYAMLEQIRVRVT